MSVVHEMLRVHFDSKTASRREISMQVQKIRDISVAFCYALSMDSIAAFILGSHVQNTWAEYAAWLEIIFAAEAEDKAAGDTPSARPELDPGGTLQGYIMTIANILREQAVALHGKAWARTTLPLALLKLGFEDDPVIFLFLPIHPADPFAEMLILAAGEVRDVFITRACECAGFH